MPRKISTVAPIESGNKIMFANNDIMADAPQQQPEGCWAAAISMLLKSRKDERGMQISATEEMIEEKAAERGVGMMGAEMASVTDAKDFIQETLPDTDIHELSFYGLDQYTPDERQGLKDHLKKTLNYAMKDHHSPVAFTDGHHYQVIVGMEGDKVWMKDTADRRLDNTKFNEPYEVSLDELIDGTPMIGDMQKIRGGQFSLTWLEDSKLLNVEAKRREIDDVSAFLSTAEQEKGKFAVPELIGSNETLKQRQEKKADRRNRLTRNYEVMRGGAKELKELLWNQYGNEFKKGVRELDEDIRQRREELQKVSDRLTDYDAKTEDELKKSKDRYESAHGPANRRYQIGEDKRRVWLSTVQRHQLEERKRDLTESLKKDEAAVRQYDELWEAMDPAGRLANQKSRDAKAAAAKKKKADAELELMIGKELDNTSTSKKEKKPDFDKHVTDADKYMSTKQAAAGSLQALAGAYLSDKAKQEIAGDPKRLYDYIKIDGKSLRELYGDKLEEGGAAFMRLLRQGGTLVHRDKKKETQRVISRNDPGFKSATDAFMKHADYMDGLNPDGTAKKNGPAVQKMNYLELQQRDRKLDGKNVAQKGSEVVRMQDPALSQQARKRNPSMAR